ncbi:hypothetical protein CBS14141_000204 [Malassezia furfur]|nr:hypothetical protein CBS14141_000204 [Malassezia furfur]
MLCPTLAFAEARALCTDLAALYTGSSASLHVPGRAEERSAAVHYDERVRAQLVLTLPSVPSKLPAPSEDAAQATYATAADAGVPHLLRLLLSALQVSMHGTREGHDVPLLTRSWHGARADAALVLRDEADRFAEADTRTPLTDAAFVGGIAFDAHAHAWRVAWLCDVVIRMSPSTYAAYPSAEPGIDTVHLDAALALRLDLSRLVGRVDAPPPQTPFHFAAGEGHPFLSAEDPYVVDVDLLALYSEGVTVPDETAEQRHHHIASRLTLLPLSMLVPHATGVQLVAPFSQSTQLAQSMARAKDLENAAIASDADIALAPLAAANKAQHVDRTARPTPARQTSMPPARTADGPPAHDVATAVMRGIVVLTRHAHAPLRVQPTMYVRMRSLNRAHTLPNGARGVFLCIELESALRHGDVQVHDVDIAVGGPIAPDAASPALLAESITPVVAPAEGGAAWPIRLGPGAQYNVLYTVQLDNYGGAPGALASLVEQWSPRRETRVTVRTAIVRAEGEAPVTCASQWDGVLDLRTLQVEQYVRLVAEAAVYDATQYDADRAPPAPPALVAGDAAFAASALAAHAEPPPPTPPPPRGAPASLWQRRRRLLQQPTSRRPGPRRTRRLRHRSPAWDRDGAGADWAKHASGARTDRRLLASVRVAPESGPADAVPVCSKLAVHVCVSNVSAEAVEPVVAWDAVRVARSALAPTALLAEVAEVQLGAVPAGSSATAVLHLCAVARGRHALGALRVRDAHTDVECVLENLGSVYVA